jgi:hypothetical protein
MKNIDFELMIEESFEDFEKESEKPRNLREFVSFDLSNLNYQEKDFTILQPKFKKKLSTSTYIKNNNKNQLF